MDEFKPSKELLARYATKVVDNRFYGVINIGKTSESKQVNPIAKQIKIINKLIDDNFYSSDGAYAKVFGRLISLMSEKILEDHC